MTTTAQAAQSALSRLGELSSDIRAAVVVDADGSPAAHWGAGEGEDMAALVAELLEQVDAATGERTSEVEVATGAGGVFALRGGRYALGAVGGRFALSSLVRWDLRHLLGELEAG